ncbi:MAG: aspartate--ammonia ligase, partial [Candidatus Marinimicrobia bacterium]|nr:aspartate--ammonia ligase [Candidatus Neomarinimicrobiota bacterium]
MKSNSKVADLAGPGISTYPEVEKILPNDYSPLQTPMKRMKALYMIKDYIEKGLAEALNLQLVQVPLIVSKDSGVNDTLDRDGSRTPIDFPAGLGLDKRIEAQIVQAATKWKRPALKQFGCKPGEGINTDMRAVRKDYFLDHDHSCYVDQWDWEQVITADQRNLDYLTDVVKKIWKVIYGAGQFVKQEFPELNTNKYPDIPEELTFIHAEEILEMYPDLPRKQRETKIIQEYPAVFIYGIGWVLKDGYPHEMRAADYDDWITETVSAKGEPM